MTCGGDIGNAEKYIKALCADVSFEYMGVQGVEMPENYIALFYVPDKFEADKIISKSMPVLASAARKIAENAPLDTASVSIMDKIKSGIVNDAFYKFVISAKSLKRAITVYPAENVLMSVRSIMLSFRIQNLFGAKTALIVWRV